VDGDYKDPNTFAQLRKELGGEQPLHYFAFHQLVRHGAEGLAPKSGCLRMRVSWWRSPSDVTWRRRKNSTEFCTAISPRTNLPHRSFSGRNRYRTFSISLRESNVEADWNRTTCEIQITMAESSESRIAQFYDEAGRCGSGSNHLLQVSILAWTPDRRHRDAWRDQKAALLMAVRPIAPGDVVAASTTLSVSRA